MTIPLSRAPILGNPGMLLAAIVLTVGGAGCASRQPGAPAGRESAAGTVIETGMASYYGDAFAGHRTASGETYRPEALTAAHRTLPFGTRVRVVRVETGASVEVRINDRGPLRSGRVIDLSYAAARQLDLLRAGVARVRLEEAR